MKGNARNLNQLMRLHFLMVYCEWRKTVVEHKRGAPMTRQWVVELGKTGRWNFIEVMLDSDAMVTSMEHFVTYYAM